MSVGVAANRDITCTSHYNNTEHNSSHCDFLSLWLDCHLSLWLDVTCHCDSMSLVTVTDVTVTWCHLSLPVYHRSQTTCLHPTLQPPSSSMCTWTPLSISVFPGLFCRLSLQPCSVHLVIAWHCFIISSHACSVYFLDAVARPVCQFSSTLLYWPFCLASVYLQSYIITVCGWYCVWLKIAVYAVMMMMLLLWLFQTQFLLVSIHTSQLFFDPDCNYPLMFGYWIGLYAVVFLVLFADFYVKSYRQPAKSSKSPVDADSPVNGPKKLQ